MSENAIIELYTELDSNPDKDFGRDKGLQSARSHHYQEVWVESLPEKYGGIVPLSASPLMLG